MSGPLVPAGGVLLRGRYEVLETLGSGGEAQVAKALDRQHARPVALKLRWVHTQARREELLREARILLGLTPHPALPLVRDDFFEGDQYVIVMDWVDGTDLARVLSTKGTPGLALPNVLAYLAEAAEALTFLHTHDPPIIHGDVKPANLILTRGGQIKLVDFGLSSSPGVEGPGRGTYGFRAPELAAGARPSRASDIFGLAATAYALLVGAPPAESGRAPSELEDGHAAALGEALAVGLATDPAARPATPGAFVEQLRAGWASTLPTGVMTFCMSDVEGSTELWETYPALMAELLVRHDGLIAAVVDAHGGRFLKAMREGDSTVSVFTSAAQAVRAAVAAARSLGDATWPDGAPIRARFGLHTGEADIRAGVYYGVAVNLAARVRGAADGGEILLSETTAALVAQDLPEGYRLVDLGPHQLKGIQRPETIQALAGPSLTTPAAPPACPYRGLPPFEPDDRRLFYGREDVVRDVLDRIEPGRLLAVIGASGSGKSSVLRAGLVAAVDAGEVSAKARTARLITPGADPTLDLDDDPADELLVVDQFEELYTLCHDAERRARFVAQLFERSGPVAIGVRADFYAHLSSDAKLAHAAADNQVLLGPMANADLRRAISEPAGVVGLRLEPGLIDLVLRDVAGEPGALPLMSHALRETWERRNGRTLTVDAYRESGGVEQAVARTADAILEATPEADRPLLRNLFVRMTELGEDVEDTRRKVSIDELVPQGDSGATVSALLKKLSDARLVTLDDGTAEVAHEVLIRRWPTLRRWLDEDREGIALHRRFSDAARLWDASGRDATDLYRGARLDALLDWVRTNGAQMNAIERLFLTASVEEAVRAQRDQAATNRRLRRALSGGGVLLLAALALLLFALISRHNAVRAEAAARAQARMARSEEIAAEAEAQVLRDPQRALLLARVALRLAPTPAAMLAVSEALDSNTVRSQLPSFGMQGCVTSNYMYLVDGGRIAVDNDCQGQIVFADLAARRITRRISVGPSSTEMFPIDGGRRLIVATGATLDSVDVQSGAIRRLFVAPFPIAYADLSPDGRTFAITDGATIDAVDARTSSVRTIARADASANTVDDLRWASNRALLIEASGQTPGRGNVPPGLSTLDVRNGTRRRVALPVPPGHLASLSFMNISPDRRTWFVTGTDIAAGSNHQVATTWAIDAATGGTRWIAAGPIGAAADSVVPSGDGRLLAVGYSQGAIDVLDAMTGEQIVRDASSSSITSGWMAFVPGDETMVTVTLDGVLRTWSTRATEQLRFQAPADPALGFTPDGADLLLVGNSGEVVDRATGRVIRRFPGFPATSVFNACNAACFSESSGLRWLTYLDPRSTVPRIVEVDGQTGAPRAAVMVPRLDAQGVAPDGRIVVAYVDGTSLIARVIDPLTGVTTSLAPAPSSLGCAATTPSFSADSRYMAIVDGCVHMAVWDLQSGRVIRSVVLPDRANASSAASGATTASGAMLSPDGRDALVTVEGGGLLRVDLATGRIDERPGTQTVAKALAISPDGRYYAVGREDGTIDEYDASSLVVIRHLTLASPIENLVYSPDSSLLAVEDADNVVRVWDACAVCESPPGLARLAARESVRPLSPSEQATFGVTSP